MGCVVDIEALAPAPGENEVEVFGVPSATFALEVLALSAGAADAAGAVAFGPLKYMGLSPVIMSGVST
jgi:hypothetical protein